MFSLASERLFFFSNVSSDCSGEGKGKVQTVGLTRTGGCGGWSQGKGWADRRVQRLLKRSEGSGKVASA